MLLILCQQPAKKFLRLVVVLVLLARVLLVEVPVMHCILKLLTKMPLHTQYPLNSRHIRQGLSTQS